MRTQRPGGVLVPRWTLTTLHNASSPHSAAVQLLQRRAIAGAEAPGFSARAPDLDRQSLQVQLGAKPVGHRRQGRVDLAFTE